MATRNESRLTQSAIERFVRRQNRLSNRGIALTCPHPRASQDDPGTERTAQCSDCKCKRPLSQFQGRRSWYKTCIRCRNRGTKPKVPPTGSAMIPWEGFAEFYKNFRCSKILPMNLHLPPDLVNLPQEQIVHHFIEHLHDTTGYEFYLTQLNNPAKSNNIAFYASCINSKDFQRQMTPEKRRRQDERVATFDCKGRLIGFVDVDQRWLHCTLHHDEPDHPADTTRRVTVDDAIRQFILGLSPALNPKKAYDVVRHQFPDALVTYSQVYYWHKTARQSS
ncbi:hypothetical protein DM01DRAFT_1382350 [Hesseltinella vesiculosa]|uniref:Uncharacterized protein n=1 Tax=Hesseltinella vesiculosa TaxID=101127 RepID=A0A1X2GM69_9FUNG|nr:hypothetical protein DM01DRAFT_1382350 [Hesseltinella vesiculosa]